MKVGESVAARSFRSCGQSSTKPSRSFVKCRRSLHGPALDFGGIHGRGAANTAMGWKNANLRSEMTRLLRRAGVSGWPRLFHSMRASRQTELQREFPLHLVSSWLGNSPRIAQQSYLLVTEDDFAKAAGAKKVMLEG